jgi:hypothetical protein
MRSRDRKAGNHIGWKRDSNGYLKDCADCGRGIYIHHDNDGTWRPYASWVEGDATQGEWILHDCPTAVSEANSIGTVSRVSSLPGDLRAILEKYVAIAKTR